MTEKHKYPFPVSSGDYKGKHRDPHNKRRRSREEADPQIYGDLKAATENVELRKKFFS